MQQTDNSRKARDRMAAGRGGGLSATILKEVCDAEFGDNWGVIKAPVDEEEDGEKLLLKVGGEYSLYLD